MRKLLVLLCVSLMVTGCVAVPVYDSGYYGYYPYYYGPYPYGYVGPQVSVFFAGHFHGGHGFHGGGFRGGRR
jgi:hypothetical protein